jgi:hypothetical protein
VTDVRLVAACLFLMAAGSVPAQTAPEFSGRLFGAAAVFQALKDAYPGWVTVKPGTAEPTLSVGGSDFVWAQGRLLPPDRADQWAAFAPQPFYEYSATVPDVASWSDERVAQAEARLSQRRSAPVRRDSTFLDALWGIHDRGTADAAQRRVRFLGLKVTVHKSLAGPLARIEARLQAARATDSTLDAFLLSLKSLDGYNWRDIAETQTRSNHAYGAAIDLVPASYKGRTPYWLWAAQDTGSWYRTAWAHRWEPHPAVVAAFEAEGFIWGGKWLLFDTIHFEYRPEILALNGLR